MTHWDSVSNWYDQLVGESGSDYHQQVILPGAIRILNPQKGEKILDVACGQGVFCRELSKLGAAVTGIDASKKLIEAARKRSPHIKYLVANAANLNALPKESFNAVSCILAIQNMEPLETILGEMTRVLKTGGKLLLVMSHPCFRIARQSGWGFDEKRKLQFRRIDSYLSSQKIPIQMQPGYRSNLFTWTFHRPLTEYFRVLTSQGLYITGLEEWISHRQSKRGTFQKAENRARNEIPLFLALLACKIRQL